MLAELGVEEHLHVRDYWPESIQGHHLGSTWRWQEESNNTGVPHSFPVKIAPEPSRTPISRWSTANGQTGPLDGIRVADFSAAWSGPMATRILAALGADVIKVEGPERMDGWRGHVSAPTHLESYPGCVPGPRPYNRNAWFNTQNPGKLSVAIDVKAARGRNLALQLISVSDLVVSNFSPGTLDRLGLGFAAARRANPGITMVEMSGFGDTGPLREHRGLGQTMEAMSGIASLIGCEHGEPLGSGSAYLDPMGGLAGAAAAVTALVRRFRRGQPQRIEVPQREAAMQWIGEQIIDAIENGAVYAPTGNRVANAVPHDAYPARGRDEWIAIAVFTESQWVSLCDACGWRQWRDDPELRTITGRRRHADKIDEALSQITTEQDKSDIARELQRAKVPAAPVQNGRDLFEDPQLRAQGWFTHLPHAEAGDCEYPGIPLEVGGFLSQPERAAPRFAEDTEDVLRSILRVDTTTIDDLARAGVIARASDSNDPGPPACHASNIQ